MVIRHSPQSCAAADQAASYLQAAPAPAPAATPAGPKDALSSIASQLRGSEDTKQQMQLLLQFARRLDPFPEQERTYGNRVMGCTSQVSTTAAAMYRVLPLLSHDALHRWACVCQ